MWGYIPSFYVSKPQLIIHGNIFGEKSWNPIIEIFERYMSFVDARVTRAEFEKNLWLKANDPLFYKDILALLSNEQVKKYPSKDAYHLSIMPLVEKMRGEPWKSS